MPGLRSWQMPYLQELDIICTCNPRGDKLPVAINWFTQARGEPRSEWSHCALVSKPGPWFEAEMMEAQREFREIRVADALRQWGTFRIDRFVRLDLELARQSIRRGKRRIGDKYPAWKLGIMALDCLQAKRTGVQVMRWAWLGVLDPRVVGSAWVGVGYQPQGETFGKRDPNGLDPDDVADWIDAHRDDYRSIVTRGGIAA